MFPTVDTENISQVTSLNRNSGPPRDVPDSSTNTQVAKQNNNRELTFNMLIKEMVFCIALALTTYGALHNTSSKVSKHPQAIRFFGPHSVVTDWYRGELSNALVEVNSEDVSFVMYYAPWDAESQYVRNEFEKAATVLNDRVHFSAINCWSPESECRLQHNKIPSWPILMVYTINSRGILYKGLRDAHSMVRFLEMIMKPMERITSTEDLVYLLSTCDAVALGYTPISESSRDYSVWYHAALKCREYDVVGEICFAVVTSDELAADLGVDRVPSARLMLWNDTREYNVGDKPHMASWNETMLVNWVLNEFTQALARIIPLWKKAFSFERYINGNPILILFTPLNPLYDQLPAYALMREIAMEYNNCNNNNNWPEVLIKLQHVQRLLYQQKNFTKFCQEYKFKKSTRKQSRYYKKEVVSQNNKYPWSNTTEKTRTGLFYFLMKRSIAISEYMKNADNTELLSTLSFFQDCSTTALPAEKSYYDGNDKCASYEDKEFDQDLDWYYRHAQTSMLPLDDDPLSAENLIQDNMRHFCKVMKFANEWGPMVLPQSVPSANITHIRGLACEKNFSLNMIAVDSVQNHHFAEALGIDIANKKDMTAVVILDTKLETQYVLSEEYSAKSVRDFIYKYTHKKLKRSMRSHVEDAEHTHYFGSDGITEQMEVNDSTIYITDLTTRTFRKFVRTPGIVKIVAVCGGACASHTSRSVAEAARLLRACGLRARAARLDARRHDLPWHYAAAAHPALLVFTPRRDGEADSRAYPARARVSAGGLVALALRSLGLPLHLRVRLALCTRAKSNIEKKKCLLELKQHITTVIERNLKYWRRAEDKDLKEFFLKRLQHLHQVSIDLSLLHATDLKENSQKQQSLLHSLSKLSNNWDIDVSLLKNSTVSPMRS